MNEKAAAVAEKRAHPRRSVLGTVERGALVVEHASATALGVDWMIAHAVSGVAIVLFLAVVVAHLFYGEG